MLGKKKNSLQPSKSQYLPSPQFFLQKKKWGRKAEWKYEKCKKENLSYDILVWDQLLISRRKYMGFFLYTHTLLKNSPSLGKKKSSKIFWLLLWNPVKFLLPFQCCWWWSYISLSTPITESPLAALNTQLPSYLSWPAKTSQLCCFLSLSLSLIHHPYSRLRPHLPSSPVHIHFVPISPFIWSIFA